jgi:hypothetical protein
MNLVKRQDEENNWRGNFSIDAVDSRYDGYCEKHREERDSGLAR